MAEKPERTIFRGMAIFEWKGTSKYENEYNFFIRNYALNINLFFVKK